MSEYQAQWISKNQIATLRKAGGFKNGLLLDSFKGFIIIQPAGVQYGDGEVLSPDAADYELRPEWCTGSKPKLAEARKLLKLDVEEAAATHRERPAPEAAWSASGDRTRP